MKKRMTKSVSKAASSSKSKRTNSDKVSKTEDFGTRFNIKIPTHLDTNEKRLEWLSQRAYKPFMQMEEKSAEKAIRVGQVLVVAREIVRKDEGSKHRWRDHLEQNFSFLKRRTAQLYIQCAIKIDPDRHPALMRLGYSTLIGVIQRAKGDTVPDFLKKNGINVKIDLEDEKEVKRMRESVLHLLTERPANKEKEKEEASEKATLKDIDHIDRLQRRALSCLKDSLDYLKNRILGREFRKSIKAEQPKILINNLAELEEVLTSSKKILDRPIWSYVRHKSSSVQHRD